MSCAGLLAADARSVVSLQRELPSPQQEGARDEDEEGGAVDGGSCHGVRIVAKAHGSHDNLRTVDVTLCLFLPSLLRRATPLASSSC